jgi:hypothetical protein
MAGPRAAMFEDSWSMDPAKLDFSEFRDRHIWGPPDSSDSRQCINMALLRKPVSVLGRAENQSLPERRRCSLWNMGKGTRRWPQLLVGATVPLSEFQRVNTSSLNEWQRLTFEWCVANPSRMLVLTSTRPRLIY